MPTLFSGINLALQSLLSQQQAIEVVEHNVANANTPGYRRQEAILTATVPYSPAGMEHSFGSGQIGTGVKVDYIKRYSMEFFDGRYRREQAESMRYSTSQNILTQVESTLAETGSDGLIPKLDDFWTGWQSLSADPTNLALRSDLHDRASDLAQAFHWKATGLLNIQKDQDLSVIQDVNEINNTATQIAKLNEQISHVKSTGDAPNDLMDQRDLLLNRLAELAGATSSVQTNGEVIVSIGGHALVVGHDTFQLTTSPDPVTKLANIVWSDGQSLTPSTGELAGLIDARDKSIPDQLAGLDTVASTLITQVNNLHSTSYGLNNATGMNFFTGTSALSIDLNPAMNTLENIGTAAVPDQVGDGSIALKIAQIANQTLLNGGTATINQFYNNQVTTFGLELQQVTASAKDRDLVAKSLSSQRESISGVNLDEEAANLVKFQRAYQASARLMSVIDDMLDRVINGMGAGH